MKKILLFGLGNILVFLICCFGVRGFELFLFGIFNMIFMIVFVIVMLYLFLNIIVVLFNVGNDIIWGGLYLWFCDFIL